jgi:hypothetical protein
MRHLSAMRHAPPPQQQRAEPEKGWKRRLDPALPRDDASALAAALHTWVLIQLYSRTRSRSSMAYKMCSLWRPRRLLIVTLFIVIYGGNFLEHVYVGIEV